MSGGGGDVIVFSGYNALYDKQEEDVEVDTSARACLDVDVVGGGVCLAIGIAATVAAIVCWVWTAARMKRAPSTATYWLGAAAGTFTCTGGVLIPIGAAAVHKRA